MNKIILIGRMTKDIEIRYTQNQKEVGSFDLAVDRNYRNANGEHDTDFFKCIAWGNLAKTIQTYTSKGSQIAIEGRVENRTYQANDGTNRYVTEVVVEGVHLIDFKKNETATTEEVIGVDDLPF
nr:MAG TPA: Single strand binding protein [Caudoviricetes sp.]